MLKEGVGVKWSQNYFYCFAFWPMSGEFGSYDMTLYIVNISDLKE